MSALGQKQTFKRLRLMSALPPKADMDRHSYNVRFVPKADSCTAAQRSLFDHFIGAATVGPDSFGPIAGRALARMYSKRGPIYQVLLVVVIQWRRERPPRLTAD
jgi:hypothetical protein